MRLRKVITPPWPQTQEAGPWAINYALPWGAWLREWPDLYWVMPWPRPRDMLMANPEALWWGYDVPLSGRDRERQ